MRTDIEINNAEDLALMNELEIKESEKKSRSLYHRRPVQEYEIYGGCFNESDAKETLSLLGYNT